CGFSHGLRAGPCSINGRLQRIIEVGMQSAYVTLESHDHVGDEVELLGNDVPLESIARAWGATEHEALLAMNRW
ncbi:MAG TPA: alanine racemase C-terminal domain-containing protein, partial [Tepidisphaeraceae bacterium]|nr:alanine racemase C-terminal domain-containing protein [Tepidisphaeraceae bacterium]